MGVALGCVGWACLAWNKDFQMFRSGLGYIQGDILEPYLWNI